MAVLRNNLFTVKNFLGKVGPVSQIGREQPITRASQFGGVPRFNKHGP